MGMVVASFNCNKALVSNCAFSLHATSEVYLEPESLWLLLSLTVVITSSLLLVNSNAIFCIYPAMHIMWGDQDQGMFLCLHVLHIHSINLAPHCPVFC